MLGVLWDSWKLCATGKGLSRSEEGCKAGTEASRSSVKLSKERVLLGFGDGTELRTV